MSKITKQEITNKLEELNLPKSISISSIVIKGGNVGFVIEIPNSEYSDDIEALRKVMEDKILELDGVEKVTAVLTAEVMQNPQVPDSSSLKKIKNVKNIIAVGSGKGGVGKSTVAANLAISLSNLGFKVGLVDADIYGPSIAKIMGVKERPEIENNQMIPPENHGVKIMSMGLIMGENIPAIWRGPMITKAINQLMMGANWGELDYLIIDLPPGTGDIHLSITQNFSIDGILLVSTPQEVALLDVKKALEMFNKVNVPILGLIENMSYFVDPAGNKNFIFGEGNIKELSKSYSVPVVAQIPLNAEISSSCDAGTPISSQENGDAIFTEIAEIVSKNSEINKKSA